MQVLITVINEYTTRQNYLHGFFPSSPLVNNILPLQYKGTIILFLNSKIEALLKYCVILFFFYGILTVLWDP